MRVTAKFDITFVIE